MNSHQSQIDPTNVVVDQSIFIKTSNKNHQSYNLISQMGQKHGLKLHSTKIQDCSNEQSSLHSLHSDTTSSITQDTQVDQIQSSSDHPTTSVLQSQENGNESSSKKHVHFNASVHQRRGISYRNYTPEEVQACWYTSDEYANITKSLRKQIWKMEQGKRFLEVKYCARGLESHTRTGALLKQMNRRDAIAAVLEEQEDQHRLGVVDDSSIAYRYYNVSSASQLWSMNVARQDQREAEKAYGDMLDTIE